MAWCLFFCSVYLWACTSLLNCLLAQLLQAMLLFYILLGFSTSPPIIIICWFLAGLPHSPAILRIFGRSFPRAHSYSQWNGCSLLYVGGGCNVDAAGSAAGFHHAPDATPHRAFLLPQVSMAGALLSHKKHVRERWTTRNSNWGVACKGQLRLPWPYMELRLPWAPYQLSWIPVFPS